MMATYFSPDELELLCFDLGVNYYELGEGGISRKVMALIRLMAGHGRIVALIDQCREHRPGVDWEALRETAVAQPGLFTLPPEKPAGGIQFAGDFRGATITIVESAEVKDIEDQPPEPGEAPYKGLQYFDETDADHFFGRELLTAQVIGRLTNTRFLAVIGASGSGKSSLVRAGILPALRRGQRLADGALPPTNSGQWATVLMTPSAHPLDSLAAALLRDSDSLTAVAELQASLTQNSRTLALAGRKLLANQTRPHLLLVIDQFEEIFTLCRQADERQAFIDNLVTAVDQDGGDITILLTLRADFYAQCAQYDSLRQLISQYQEYIGAMSREELARAIVQPAALGEWRIQEGLVEQMLDDVGDEPGALPLLSHALLETWARRRERTMTLSGYKESGGVRGAIAQTAETIFQQRLTAEQRPIARMIFVRLTELGEAEDGETPDTRRRAAFSELITRATDPATLDAVLAILAEARLVTTDILPPDETKVVEVAHEALIREWPTLRQWLDQDRADLIRHRQLTADVNDWLKLGRDAGALYRGARLAQMQGWIESFPEPLSLEEQAFLEASQAAAAEEAEKQRRLERARRLQTILIRVTAVLLLTIVAAVVYVASNPSRAAQQIEAAATITPCLPQPMDGDFNIAVAEMVVLGPDGRIDYDSRAGRQLSGRVYDDLSQAFTSESGVQIRQDSLELRQQRCLTIGLAADDLAGVGSPAATAEFVNADVLIYGALQPVGDRAELLVKFYLAPQLGLDFSSMVGTYAFETAVPVFDIDGPGSEVDAVLGPQMEALARIARGFINELLGRPEQALADFQQVAELVPNADFAHFFVGQENLFLAQTDTERAEAYETAAAAAFQRAPENARAQIGLGGVYFVRAQRRLNAALDNDFAGDFAAELVNVEEDADSALALFSQVADGGSQVEKYGVPVDQIARLGEGISTRLLGEVNFYQGDSEEAQTLIDEAVVTLETAVPALEAVNDQRLLAQTYQALGSVYEWQSFLLEQAGDETGSRAANRQARDYYGQCLGLGEDFPFDAYLVAEIVEKLCRPHYEALPES
jgi:tetratricopeptide (TPR) repeat protein